MRDTWSQGAQERRARRDRNLARRREHGRPIDLGTLTDTAARLAGAIALDSSALVIWNVGAHSPLALLPELIRLGRNPRALLVRMAGLIVGLVFVAAATILVAPAIGRAWDAFVPVEIGTLLAALGVDYLIGRDLRRILNLP